MFIPPFFFTGGVKCIVGRHMLHVTFSAHTHNRIVIAVRVIPPRRIPTGSRSGSGAGPGPAGAGRDRSRPGPGPEPDRSRPGPGPEPDRSRTGTGPGPDRGGPDRGRTGAGTLHAYSLDKGDENSGGFSGALPGKGILMQGHFDQGGERRPVGGVHVGKGAFGGHPFVLDAQHLEVDRLKVDGHRFDAVIHNGGGSGSHPGGGDPELHGGGPLRGGEGGLRWAGQRVDVFRQHAVEKISIRPSFQGDVQLGVSRKKRGRRVKGGG